MAVKGMTMRHHTIVRTVIMSACVAWAAASFAQNPKAPAKYEPSTEQTVSGIITQVVSVSGPDDTVGVHLNVKTADATVRVHVAPALFIGENNFWFQIDDQVSITGANVLHDGDVALWARLLTKEGKTLKIRNDDGTPLWKTEPADADGCGVAHAIVRY
jgi:hypothetical protein